jgi:hypothetical protein
MSTFMFIWMSLLRIDLKHVRNSSARFGRILARKDVALNFDVHCACGFANRTSLFKSLFPILCYIRLSFVRMWFSMGVMRHLASYAKPTR